MAESWHSVHGLYLLHLECLPRSQKGIRERAQRDSWPSREVPGRGGPGGKRIEYRPPPDVQLQIDELVARRVPYDSRSDEGLRHAVSESPNPESAYEQMRRIRDTTQLLRRLQDEIGYELPGAWLSVLQELLFAEQLTELGARRLIEHLKVE